MTRSSWKGPNIIYKESKKLIKQNNLKANSILRRTFNRDFPVLINLIGKKIHIYNGRLFKSIRIVEEHVGYKLGDFCSTRKSAVKKIEKNFNTRKKNKK